MSKTKPVFQEEVIDVGLSDWLYNFLATTIEWGEGVRFTRKAASLIPGQCPEVDRVVNFALSKLDPNKEYQILGLYLNWYLDGEMFAPLHRHQDTHQLVLSLGATRTLRVGVREYQTTNGSAILFGSSMHGVPKGYPRNLGLQRVESVLLLL